MKTNEESRIEVKPLLTALKKMGHSRREIEKKLGYREFYLDQAVSLVGNEKLHTLLLLYKEWAEMKAGTIGKYNSLNSSALGHPRPTDPEAIALALEELARSVREMPNNTIPASPAVSGRTAVAAAGKVIKRGIRASADKSGKDR